MDEIEIETLEWTAPEYKHTEKSVDFLWTIGLVAIVAAGLAIWWHNYVFSLFILISGATLVLFSVRHPRDVYFSIATEGFTMSKRKYPWKNIKGFDIKKNADGHVLLIEIDKYFLPVYTIPLPEELIPPIKENMSKVTKSITLEESKSMKFMERLGF